MLIKVTYLATEHEDESVRVDFSFGEKAAIGPSYIMAHRGALTMPRNEWAALQEILTRGAKRPTTVVIEQAG